MPVRVLESSVRKFQTPSAEALKFAVVVRVLESRVQEKFPMPSADVPTQGSGRSRILSLKNSEPLQEGSRLLGSVDRVLEYEGSKAHRIIILGYYTCYTIVKNGLCVRISVSMGCVPNHHTTPSLASGATHLPATMKVSMTTGQGNSEVVCDAAYR